MDSAEHVWRQALALRLFAWIWIVGYPVVFIAVVVTQLIDADGVTVRNPLVIRHFRYSEIAAAIPDYNGIVIRPRTGRGVVAVAVQKSNLSSWTKREVRADHVAKFIEQRATGVGA